MNSDNWSVTPGCIIYRLCIGFCFLFYLVFCIFLFFYGKISLFKRPSSIYVFFFFANWKTDKVKSSILFLRWLQLIIIIFSCIKPTFLTAFCSSNMNVNPHDIYSKVGCIRLVVKSSGNSYVWLKYDEVNLLPEFQGHCQ